MIPNWLLRDVLPAVALVAALGVVYAVDGCTPPAESAGGGDGDGGDGDRRVSFVQVKRPGTMKAGSVYAERTAPDRQEVVQKRGGSPISEQAVQAGFDWLARHQAQDGSWSDRCLGHGATGRCEAGRACGGPGHHYPVAQTGLALLALQGGGHYAFNKATYSDSVRRGLDWLAAHQRTDGRLADPDQHYMYEHAIGTFALAEACAIARDAGEEPDPKYLQAAQQAVLYLQRTQHRDGGWRYTAELWKPSDTSISGWVVLALKSAKAAELKVDPTAVGRLIQFFETCERRGQNGVTNYTADGHLITQATTGIGMLVHHFLLERSDTPLVNKAAGHLARVAERTWPAGRGAVDYYTWYNCTLGMYLAGGDPWERWNKVVRDRVIGLQVTAGCERGSWPPNDQWSDRGGRVYSTALAVLTLEVYYRFARKGVPAAPDAPVPPAPK